MSSLIELEIPSGYTAACLFKRLKKTNLPTTIVNLKSFRAINNSSDPLSYLYSIFLEHIKSIEDSKKSFLIFDKFDLWSSLVINNQESQYNRYKSVKSLRNSYLKSVRLSEGVEDKVNKCTINWTYKFLYWIRNSVIYLLKEEFFHSLSCVCIYADPFNSRIFYDDIFDKRYTLEDFVKAEEFGNFELGKCKENKFDLLKVKQISNSLNFYSSSNSEYLKESVYDSLSKNTRILNLNVPFEVECEGIELSSITLIVGAECSGKSTLLKSIAKYCHDQKGTRGVFKSGEVDTSGNININYVYNLEYCELASQYVGSAESYVKNIFTRARYNKPSLVVFDGIELLFERVDIEEERPIPVTVSNTLLNQLYNLEGVKFLASTSGNCQISSLSSAFLNMVTSVIVLTKNSEG